MSSLADVPEQVIERIAEQGFEWIYLLGVWQTGEIGPRVSRTDAGMLAGYPHDLPGWTDADVCGSPFAITEYRVHRDFGGDGALALFRKRMHARGMGLILDYVPNHTAIDHPWATSHPDRFIPASEARSEQSERSWERGLGPSGTLVHGGDGGGSWPDTLQLDFRNATVIDAMIGELHRIAAQCDGVRCDMAMLVHPHVFERNWGGRALDLWVRAISEVKARHPDLVFIAETYFLHWELQQQGFDFTYDKVLYDRLVARDATAVRLHLYGDHSFQKKLVRFLENHDEPRAASTFSPPVHRAAAVIAYFAPGMAFFHDGQLEGRRVRTSVHLRRRVPETIDAELRRFYQSLLRLLPLLEDEFWLCDPRPAWEGNGTHERFVVFRRGALLIAVNYGGDPGQCYVTIGGFVGEVLLDDRLNGIRYVRSGEEMATRGLFLDLPAWGHHVFVMSIA